MPESETMRDRIVDAALKRARGAGYDGFSFRDIAADVGIKSASVHYHFATKPALLGAVLERYRRETLDRLGDPDGLTGQEALNRLVGLFREAAAGGSMCLCAALGGTPAALPPEVRDAVSHFADTLIHWLEGASAEMPASVPPASAVALLEGALLLANLRKDPALFDTIVAPALQAPAQG